MLFHLKKFNKLVANLKLNECFCTKKVKELKLNYRKKEKSKITKMGKAASI